MSFYRYSVAGAYSYFVHDLYG